MQGQHPRVLLVCSSTGFTGILKPWERSHATTKHVVYKQKLFSTGSWTSCAQRNPDQARNTAVRPTVMTRTVAFYPVLTCTKKPALSLSLYIYLHTTLRWTVHNVCLVTCYMYPRPTATLEPAIRHPYNTGAIQTKSRLWSAESTA